MDVVEPSHGFRPAGTRPFSWAGERTPGATAVLFLSGRIGRLAELLTQRAVRPHGLDSSQLAVLVALVSGGQDGTMSPADLSELLAQTRSGITRTVKRLERDELVARDADPADGRSVLLRVTPVGAARMSAALDDLLEQFERQVPDDGAVELPALARALEAVDALFEQPPAPLAPPDPVIASEPNTERPRAAEPRPSVGTTIRDLRTARGLTQKELAAAVGVGAPHLSKIERDLEQPSESVVTRLGTVLGVDADELLLRSGIVPRWMIETLAADPVRSTATLRAWSGDRPS